MSTSSRLKREIPPNAAHAPKKAADHAFKSTAPDLFDTPLFNRLVGLMEDQNVTAREQRRALEEQRQAMKDIRTTLEGHGKHLKVLTRDALKGQNDVLCDWKSSFSGATDDQPYDEKKMDDESTCAALFEMAIAKTHEQVDEWIKRMDVSLVFVRNILNDAADLILTSDICLDCLVLRGAHCICGSGDPKPVPQ